MRISIPVTMIAALGACATPSDRIAGALEAYGFTKPQAQCVGDRLQKRLSISQLAELARLAREVRAQQPVPGRVSIEDLLRLSGDVRDPKVPIEVARAGAGCGLLSSPMSGLMSAIGDAS